MPRYVWGVDSAQNVNEELFGCVRSEFGYPKFWGRYLTTVPNASEGLTKEEVSYIHKKGIKILPIYNDFNEAVGYREGTIAARNAIFHARRIGFPDGTVLFANVERFFSVDSAWIRAWVDAIYPSGYRSGFYHDPESGDFHEAYCNAVKQDNQIFAQSILWSAEPDLGVTKPTNIPPFNPKKPNCKANVWMWQYGRDSKECPIDTNLVNQRLMSMLW